MLKKLFYLCERIARETFGYHRYSKGTYSFIATLFFVTILILVFLAVIYIGYSVYHALCP